MKQDRHFALFRIFTSLIFFYAGVKHLLHADKIFSRIEQCTLYNQLPYPTFFSILITASGVVMVLGAILLAFGKYQRLAALILLLVLTGITLTIQLENLDDLGPFFKNVAIAGSLLFIIKQRNHELKIA